MKDEFKIWFSIIPISVKAKIMLLKSCGTCENIYENRVKLFEKIPARDKVLSIDIKSEIINKISLDIERGIYKLVIYGDSLYIEGFKNIEEPPFCIFYKGDLEKINRMKFLGIVGSRKNSEYGEIVTKEIVSSIAGQCNIGVVSGGAIGIDSIAHYAAIDNNIFNIAVLGCGIDICYPKSNVLLFNKIINNGVIISEFPPGESPMYYNFPKRNRLISAISEAIIVTEAGVRSGATNTAMHACIQNKSVYAVPGNINSENSKGCNKLINDGALVYLNIEQVFKELGLFYEMGKKDKKYDIKLKILSVLGEKPVHFDKIREKIKVDSCIINELLFEMQFNNEIIGLIGNNYMKILRKN